MEHEMRKEINKFKDFLKENSEEKLNISDVIDSKYLEKLTDSELNKMTDLQKQFQEEKDVSFDGIPINGVHLEYIIWLESQIQALRIHDVVGRSEQLKEFADYAQKRMWEDGDKDLSEFVDEFLRL